MVLKFFSLTLQLCVIRLIYVNSVNSEHFPNYLTRDIYVRYNDLGTKIWGFFPKTAKFRTPN